MCVYGFIGRLIAVVILANLPETIAESFLTKLEFEFLTTCSGLSTCLIESSESMYESLENVYRKKRGRFRGSERCLNESFSLDVT